MILNWSQTFDEMSRLRREMDQVFERNQRFFGVNSPAPALNVYGDSDQLWIVAEAPGLKQKDLEISFLNGELKIKGQRCDPDLGEQAEALRAERQTNMFEKSLHIPVEIDADKIQASLTNGILKLTLPKAEKAKARQIEIQ